jgi:hypothetical protein
MRREANANKHRGDFSDEEVGVLEVAEHTQIYGDPGDQIDPAPKWRGRTINADCNSESRERVKHKEREISGSCPSVKNVAGHQNDDVLLYPIPREEIERVYDRKKYDELLRIKQHGTP